MGIFRQSRFFIENRSEDGVQTTCGRAMNPATHAGRDHQNRTLPRRYTHYTLNRKHGAILVKSEGGIVENTIPQYSGFSGQRADAIQAHGCAGFGD